MASRSLGERRRQRLDPDRAAAVVLGDAGADSGGRCASSPRPSTSSRVSAASATARVDRACAADRGEVAHAAQQAVGDARRAARAPGDLGARRRVERSMPSTRAPRADDRARARPARRNRGAAGCRSGRAAARVIRPARVVAPTSVKGGRSMRTERARRPLADDQVELEVLHRRIEDLLDRRREAVDLVDEQHVARLQIGEDARRGRRRFWITGPEVARKPTPSSRATICASVVLPRPGGPKSSTWSSASPRGCAASMKTAQILAHLLLADELVERLRAQRRLGRVLLGARRGRRAIIALVGARSSRQLLQAGADQRVERRRSSPSRCVTRAATRRMPRRACSRD